MRIPLQLFEGFGIELEYMIVNRNSLNVMPVSDKLLEMQAGEPCSDVEFGRACWSNELVLHVLEFKNNEPLKDLREFPAMFHECIQKANQLLSGLNACLMPTGMHPWMDPASEMKLWPHDNNEIYETYDRIFNCKGHGWCNLQSMHINLPFANDEEFARLHAAIRLVLPLIPALSASSPVAEGRLTNFKDYRLEVYRKNQQRVPHVTGKVIPEQAFSQAEYHEKIFQPLFAQIAEHDEKGLLREEWLNSRGAIARWDRNAIEIRVIDTQECPTADLAIASLVIAVVKNMVEGKWSDLEYQKSFEEDELAEIFLESIRTGEYTVISNERYLKAFGFPDTIGTSTELWSWLFENLHQDPAVEYFYNPIKHILANGCLSTRILKALNNNFSESSLHNVYSQLRNCLENDELFG
jgi:glutamate---cysteine ligase / carboxylate-amine ligase